VAGEEDAGEEHNNNSEWLIEPQSDDNWDLVQVIDPGMPMDEEVDPTLEGTDVARFPRPNQRRGLRPRIRRATAVTLQTGFTFTLTTPDPVEYPLPHPDLLKIHAALMRVARAAGAESFQEDEVESQDEGDHEHQQEYGPGEGLPFALRRFLEDTVPPEEL